MIVGASAQSDTLSSIDLTVIGNKKGAPSNLTLLQLKSIFRGEYQRWPDGTKVVLVLMKTNTAPGISTCKKIYDMSPDKVKRFWLALSFSGKADAPIFCNSVLEFEAIVSQNPGAIGIKDTSKTSLNVKIVLIDGKKTF